MQIDYFGGNAFRIKTKTSSLVFDDNLAKLGKKPITTEDDAVVITNDSIIDQPKKFRIILDTPGDYEVGDIMLKGVPAQANMDEKGTTKATIFRGIAGDIRFAVLGHVNPELNDEQLEAIGVIDVLIVPVGGYGYTLDGIAAAKLAKQIEPKLIVPTHFAQEGIKYEVEQGTTEEFIKAMGVETAREESKTLKIKKNDFGEKAEVVIINP